MTNAEMGKFGRFFRNEVAGGALEPTKLRWSHWTRNSTDEKTLLLLSLTSATQAAILTGTLIDEWLNDTHSTWGAGLGPGGTPLITDMPGWTWDSVSKSYFINGSTTSGGNPNPNQTITTLEVTKPGGSYSFSLRAPEAVPQPSTTYRRRPLPHTQAPGNDAALPAACCPCSTPSSPDRKYPPLAYGVHPARKTAPPPSQRHAHDGLPLHPWSRQSPNAGLPPGSSP
ncbi:MAG: hypothetical protein QNL68_21550 [Akkermansiaceae bacterium]